jgi:hypothetical protein
MSTDATGRNSPGRSGFVRHEVATSSERVHPGFDRRASWNSKRPSASVCGQDPFELDE